MSDIHIVSNKINVSKIIDEIDMYPDHWLVDTRRQEILHEQIHTETINLVLAYDSNPAVKDVRDSHTYRPSLLCKYYPETMKILKTYFPVGLSRVAIVKLKPGKMVSPHIDLGKYYEIRHRYHLVIKGSYLYQVEEEGKQVSPGTLFWFNNKKNHSAFNNTSEDRISVIFDVEY